PHLSSSPCDRKGKYGLGSTACFPSPGTKWTLFHNQRRVRCPGLSPTRGGGQAPIPMFAEMGLTANKPNPAPAQTKDPDLPSGQANRLSAAIPGVRRRGALC